MRTSCLLAAALVAGLFVDAAFAQKGSNLGASQVKVYKKVGEVELHAYLFYPPEHKPEDKRPAIVFYFGGGWRSGSPKQFVPQAKYLASRGMVAIPVEYRVHSRHGVKIAECVADAKSAVRWVRSHAKELGIDADRIASAGGSAGGHLAAAVGTLPGFDQQGEDTSVSCVPNAMLLFNPALDLSKEAFQDEFRAKRYPELAKRMGADGKDLSPTHQIKKGIPPTIIFHGKGDTTVPYSQAEAFAERMEQAGNRCKLCGYDGQPHGFFNFGRAGNKNFVATMREADAFLAALGWLEGEPTLQE